MVETLKGRRPASIASTILLKARRPSHRQAGRKNLPHPVVGNKRFYHGDPGLFLLAGVIFQTNIIISSPQ